MSRRASGLKAWVWQRLSALYIMVFSLFLIGWSLGGNPGGQAAWQSLWAMPAVNLAAMVAAIALAAHAWVGMRDIVMDYIHPLGARITALSVIGLVLLFSALWALLVLWQARGPLCPPGARYATGQTPL